MLFLMAISNSLGDALFWPSGPSGTGEPRAPAGKGQAPGEGSPSGPRPGLRLKTKDGGLRREEYRERGLVPGIVI